jgi:hypothetical protein
MIACVTDPIFIICRLKKTIRSIWAYALVLEIGTVANMYRRNLNGFVGYRQMHRQIQYESG